MTDPVIRIDVTIMPGGKVSGRLCIDFEHTPVEKYEQLINVLRPPEPWSTDSTPRRIKEPVVMEGALGELKDGRDKQAIDARPRVFPLFTRVVQEAMQKSVPEKVDPTPDHIEEPVKKKKGIYRNKGVKKEWMPWHYHFAKECKTLHELIDGWDTRFPTSPRTREQLEKLWDRYHPPIQASEKLTRDSIREMQAAAPPRDETSSGPRDLLDLPENKFKVGDTVHQVAGMNPAVGNGVIDKIEEDGNYRVKFPYNIRSLPARYLEKVPG
jgi:hypothetical protein